MKRVLKVLLSIYNFFAGDVILLVAVAVAFGLAAFLIRGLREERVLVIVSFIVPIVLGLVTTIGRELGSARFHGDRRPQGKSNT